MRALYICVCGRVALYDAGGKLKRAWMVGDLAPIEFRFADGELFGWVW